MSAGEQAPRRHARLVFALGAFTVLAAIVGVVVAADGGDDDEVAGPCLGAWNSSETVAIDGTHAYAEHGYREAQVASVDERGELVADDAAGARCAVIFAAAQVEFEPDFGVRVQDGSRWVNLEIGGKVALERIAELQRAATEDSNATLLPSGQLSKG